MTMKETSRLSLLLSHQNPQQTALYWTLFIPGQYNGPDYMRLFKLKSIKIKLNFDSSGVRSTFKGLKATLASGLPYY